MLLTGPEDTVIAYPSLPADELELFFSQSSDQGQRFFHALRASKSDDFAEPMPIPELDAACLLPENRTISLSDDGLRAYVVCVPGVDLATVPLLHVARRAQRDAVFVYDDMTYGMVGPAPDVTADELTLFTTSDQDTVGRNPPREYSRSSLSEPFVTGNTVVPDVGPDGYYLASPSLAPDGLTLYGTLYQSIGVARRTGPGQPFATPEVVFASDPSVVYGSPEVSADCRTLYYGRIDVDADGAAVWTLSASTR